MVRKLRQSDTPRRPRVTGIRLRFKAFDHLIMDREVQKIMQTVLRTGGMVKGPVPLPNRTKKFTVNRSPHIDKKSREQFEMRTHKRLLDVLDPTPQTVDALMHKTDIASGVEVKVEIMNELKAAWQNAAE